MWPVSAGFLAAWRHGGTRIRRVYLDPRGDGVWQPVRLTDYRITASRGDSVVSRYAGQVSLPPGFAGLIDEHATRVQVRAGFMVGGAEELIPVGTLTVDDVYETHTGEVTITGYSDELRAERAGFRTPHVVEAGSALSAIVGLLAAVTPTVAITATRDAQVARTVFEDSRWRAVVQCAAAADVEVSVGPDGVWRIVDVPVLGAPVVVLPGTISRQLRRTRRGVSNVVVVTGDRVDTGAEPPRGEASDDNPFSSTFVGGVFGEVVTRVGNPLMLTNASCAAAARTYLAKRVGRSRQLSVTIQPADFLEPGDTLGVTVNGMTEAHVVDVVQHSSSGAQTLDTREVQS